MTPIDARLLAKAKEIVANPAQFAETPDAFAQAFAVLKEARGQSFHYDRISTKPQFRTQRIRDKVRRHAIERGYITPPPAA